MRYMCYCKETSASLNLQLAEAGPRNRPTEADHNLKNFMARWLSPYPNCVHKHKRRQGQGDAGCLGGWHALVVILVAFRCVHDKKCTLWAVALEAHLW